MNVVDKKTKKRRSTCTFMLIKGKNSGKRCCDVNPYCKNRHHRIHFDTESLMNFTNNMVSYKALNAKLKFYSLYGSNTTPIKSSEPGKDMTKCVQPESFVPPNHNSQKPKHENRLVAEGQKVPVSLGKLSLVFRQRSGPFRQNEIVSNVCPYCHKTFSKKSNTAIHVKRGRCQKYLITV